MRCKTVAERVRARPREEARRNSRSSRDFVCMRPRPRYLWPAFKENACARAFYALLLLQFVLHLRFAIRVRPRWYVSARSVFPAIRHLQSARSFARIIARVFKNYIDIIGLPRPCESVRFISCFKCSFERRHPCDARRRLRRITLLSLSLFLSAVPARGIFQPRYLEARSYLSLSL